MSDKDILCVATIRNGFDSWRCSRKGSMKHDGRLFCKTHHPPTAKEKDRIRSEKWQTEWKAEKEKRDAPAKEIKSLRDKLAASECRVRVAKDAIEGLKPCWPPEVFTGSSGDPGPVALKRCWDALALIDAPDSKVIAKAKG